MTKMFIFFIIIGKIYLKEGTKNYKQNTSFSILQIHLSILSIKPTIMRRPKT
jgi:hypothetical protein